MPLGGYDIGLGPDAAELKLSGEVVGNFLRYEVTCPIFDQPGRFTVSVGWADSARDLIAKYPKGTPFELSVGGIKVMTGKVDGRSTQRGGYTELLLNGRDNIAALENHYLDEERSFSESSYFALTEKMLAEALDSNEFILFGSNTANRKAITGVNVVVTKAERVSEELEVEVAQHGTSRVVRKTLKAQLGENCMGFMERQYKRAGLFLWCGADGSYILSEPNPNQEPLTKLVRERERITPATNVEECEWKDDASTRHSLCVVRGRGGGTRSGRTKIVGEFADAELVGLGYRNQISSSDNDIRTRAEAEFAARRRNAEERRQGFQLSYLVTGHTTPHVDGSGRRVLWAPDTVTLVRDDELGIDDRFYVHEVSFLKSSAGTFTRVSLTRIEDLVFAEELQT